MLKRFQALMTMVALGAIMTACTGGSNNPTEGGIVITAGESLNVSMVEARRLSIGDSYAVSLKNISADFSSANPILDITPTVKVASPSNTYKLVLPKNVQSSWPMLVVVDVPELETQLIDVLYDSQSSATPGLASTLAYNLMKYYPARKITDYSAADFAGLKNLIQTRILTLMSQSEQLSYFNTPYVTLTRYLLNGMAFNPDFLTAIRQYGVNYGFSLNTPPGLQASDTPENSLIPYQYAGSFTVNGNAEPVNPFNQLNNTPTLLSGAAQPNPGTNIYQLEGNSVTVSAAAFDLDGDLTSKMFIVQYLPRVLPASITTLVVPEPTPEYQVMTSTAAPGQNDIYRSNPVGYNEALDTDAYACGTPATLCDTAYRNVYYLVSDGMVNIPFHWNFKYIDVNRPPQILTSAAGTINDTSLDTTLASAAGDTVNPLLYPAGWYPHASHCETDPNYVYQPSTQSVINNSGGLLTFGIVEYQPATSRANSTWACVFKVWDPDLDDDPNGAADQFYYSVQNTDPFAQIFTNDTYVWPPVSPATITEPISRPGLTVSTCVDGTGKVHNKCGQGVYKVTIDNAVKVAAETSPSLIFNYDAYVYDRQTGGLNSSRTISRQIKFQPNPPRLVNFNTTTPPLGTVDMTVEDSSAGGPVYERKDIYLKELANEVGLADLTPTIPNQLATLGFGEAINPATMPVPTESTLTGAANRVGKFFTGNVDVSNQPLQISDYLTQPRSVVSVGTVNGAGVVTGYTTSVSLLGHSMIPGNTLDLTAYGFPVTAEKNLYSTPHEFDSTCDKDANNFDTATALWDQRDHYSASLSVPGPSATPPPLSGGWTFEIDAVDNDNVNLRPNEPSDPVYFTLSHDVNTTLNDSQGGVFTTGLLYCSAPVPTSDPIFYQTYPTAGDPTKQMDYCKWIAVPTTAALMQPVPVFYTGKDSNGNPTTVKYVYHRMRFKWQPKDQAMVGAGNSTKLSPDPQGYIQNILSNLTISGNVYSQKGVLLDRSAITNPLVMLALHKDMASCIQNVVYPNQYQYIHQQNQNPIPLTFNVADENKTLGVNTARAGATYGRYQAELVQNGTRLITDPEFLKFVPFIENCTTVDTVDPTPVGPTPTPPPSIALSEAAIWYAGADSVPKLRLTSATNPNISGLNTMFCLKSHFLPMNNARNSGAPIQNVVLFTNTNVVNPVTIALNSCFSRASITIPPNEKQVAMATSCSAGALGALPTAANVTSTIAYTLDPTAYGFPAGTPFTMKLFPSLYGADENWGCRDDVGKVANVEVCDNHFNVNAPNLLQFNLAGVDTFSYNPATGTGAYAGNNTWVSTLGPSVPGFVEYIDWDNQPTSITIATPTPAPTGNFYYRQTPGDATRVQVFVKNRAAVSFPLQSSDALVAGGLEQDAYDVAQFNFGAWPAPSPNHLPTLSAPSGRTSCTDLPAGYPSLSVGAGLYASIANYRQCLFSWTPAAADDGLKYSLLFTVQDNANANSAPAAGTPATLAMGAGAKHPSSNGISSTNYVLIPADHSTALNGPLTNFYVDIESLETNTPPNFTNGTFGSPSPMVGATYSTTPGNAAWSYVFPSSSGVAPNTSGPVAGDYIYAPTGTPVPTALVENLPNTFLVYASKSALKTPTLRTLSAVAKPTTVYIIDGNYAGQTYTVPSFASGSFAVTATQVSAGNYTFSFKWTPTDLEAYHLSNPGGFLIPLTITDQGYSPATDAGFPSQFKTAAMPGKIWVWAKLSVLNNTPQVFYLKGATETALASANLSFQTNTTPDCTNYTVNCYKVRIKDQDLARLTATGAGGAGENTGFTKSFTGPSITALTISALGPIVTASPYYYQEFNISANPANTELGSYSSPLLTVTDPGDPSQGLTVTATPTPSPSACTNNCARASTLTAIPNVSTTAFSLQVVGKPIFLTPNTTDYKAYVYASQSFAYPVSVSISRAAEVGKTIFMGIDTSTTTTPMKTTSASSGIYVNEAAVVKWPGTTTSNIIPSPASPDRTFPIGAVLQSYCMTPIGSAPVTTISKSLVRYNEAGNVIQQCNLSAANVTANLALNSLTLTLVGPTAAAVPALLTTEVDRTYTAAPTPSDVPSALNLQYGEFKAHCSNNILPQSPAAGNYCDQAPVTANATVAGNNNINLTASGAIGSATFTSGAYSAVFNFNTSAGLSTTKIYKDSAPTNARLLTASIDENESVVFKATVPAPTNSPYPQYHWYVNGCLKSSGLVTSANLSYALTINSLMSGMNNDCTGEYNIAETNPALLGKLVVRLSLVNGTESLNSTTDGSSNYYVWNLNVLNTDPNLQTDPTVVVSAPIALPYTGTVLSKYAMPVTYPANGANYLAYTDMSSSTGMAVKLAPLSNNGNILTTGGYTLNCNTGFKNQPNWLGINPSPDGHLYISASNNTNTGAATTSSFPVGGSTGPAGTSYGTGTSTCYSGSVMNTSNKTVTAASTSTSTDSAGYLPFSLYSLSDYATAKYTASSSLYTTNSTDYYLLFGLSQLYGGSNFWSYSISTMTTLPPQLTTPYSNVVRKMITSGSNLFALIGAKDNTTGVSVSSPAKGFILMKTLAAGAGTALTATGNRQIAFAASASSPDCNFEGTPLDAIYVANKDTLYVLVSGISTGHFVAIRNTLTAPTCSLLTDNLGAEPLNPSINASEHNGNISKMVYDPVRGMIYGVINQTGTSQPGQVFSFDVYGEQLALRGTSSTISAYEIIYSPAANALYLFDNRKSGTTNVPTLYRIW